MNFQTRDMTAMDIWLLTCMLFVALATFEYAILLAMRFGTHSKIKPNEKMNNEIKITRKCLKIDRISLKVFLLTYLLAVGTYFYYLRSQYGQYEEPDSYHKEHHMHDAFAE